MKKTKFMKRFLSLLLILSMVLSYLPYQVSAEEESVEAKWGTDVNNLTNSGTYADAVAAATAENSTVKYIQLQSTVMLNDPVYMDNGTFTVDLNNYEVRALGTPVVVRENADVIFTDTSAECGGRVILDDNSTSTHNGQVIGVSGGGKLTIEAGDYRSIWGEDAVFWVLEDSTLVINGGKFTTWSGPYIGRNAGNLTVNGGTFNPANDYFLASGEVSDNHSVTTINGGEFNGSVEAKAVVYNAGEVDFSGFTGDLNNFYIQIQKYDNAVVDITLPDNALYYDTTSGKTLTEVSDDGVYKIKMGNCKVSFDANGGTGSMDSVMATDTYILPECTFTPPEGKQFMYWSRTADGSGSIYRTGSQAGLSSSEETVFYAIWGDYQARWGTDINNLVNTGTFIEAIQAVNAEESTVGYIQLHQDIQHRFYPYYFEKGEFVLDLNGCKLEATQDGLSFGSQGTTCKMTITDTSDAKSGEYIGPDIYNSTGIILYSGSEIIFEAGTFKSNGTAVYIPEDASVTVNAGVNFQCQDNDIFFNYGTLIINGGTFESGYGIIRHEETAYTALNGGDYTIGESSSHISYSGGLLDLSNLGDIVIGFILSMNCSLSEDNVLLIRDDIAYAADLSDWYEVTTAPVEGDSYIIVVPDTQVYFDANGGSGEMESELAYEIYRMPECSFTAPDGATFLGWSDTPNGEVKWESDDFYTPGDESEITFYAIWEYEEVVPPEAKWGSDSTNLTGSGTFEDALRAAEADGNDIKYVQLQSEANLIHEELKLTEELYIDLNGYDINCYGSGRLEVNDGAVITFADNNGDAIFRATVSEHAEYPVTINNGKVILESGEYYTGQHAFFNVSAGSQLIVNKDVNVNGYSSSVILNKGDVTINEGAIVSCSNGTPIYNHGNVVIHGGSFDAANYIAYSYDGTITINGGEYSCGYDFADVYMFGGKLDLTNMGADAVGFTVYGSSTANNVVIPKGTMLVTSGNEVDNSFSIEGIHTVVENDNVIYVGGVCLLDGEYLASNAETATKVKPNTGGYAYYKDGVLKLCNYECEKLGYEYRENYMDYYALIYSKRGLRIKLVGDNVLTSTDKFSEDGIGRIATVSGNLTIEGTGSIESNCEQGFYATGEMNINGGSYLLNVRESAFWSDDYLNILGGNIRISTYVYGIRAKKNITTMDCMITINDAESGEEQTESGTYGIFSDSVIEIKDGSKININVENCIRSNTGIGIYGGEINLSGNIGISSSTSTAIRGGIINIEAKNIGISVSSNHLDLKGGRLNISAEKYPVLIGYNINFSGGMKILEPEDCVVGTTSSTMNATKGFVTNEGADVLEVTIGTEAPIVQGVIEEKTYYTTQKVVIADEDLATVTVNGEQVYPQVATYARRSAVAQSVTEIEIMLEGNKDATYEIIATDNEGNESGMTVVMKPISELAKEVDALNKDNVTDDNVDAIENTQYQIAAIDLTNATEEEKAAIESLNTKCEDLIEVVEKSDLEEISISNSADKTVEATVNLYPGEEKIVIAELDRADYYGEENEQPVIEGYLFSGWFADIDCTQAFTGTDGIAYAKFVDADVLKVMAQASVGIRNMESGKLRFLSTVDSANYANVGFHIEYNGKVLSRKLNNVYKRFYAVKSDGSRKYYEPTIASPISKYFIAFTLTGIPKSAHNVPFNVTPYWTTLDGTYVEGVKTPKVISSMNGY